MTSSKFVKSTLLRRMIENIKGDLNTSIHRQQVVSEDRENERWLDTLHSIKRDVNPSVIDTDDERTQYILSK